MKQINRSNIQYKYSNWRLNGIPTSRENCAEVVGGSFYRLIREHSNRQAIRVDDDIVTWTVFEVTFEYHLEGKKFKTAQLALQYLIELTGKQLSNTLHWRGEVPEHRAYGYAIRKVVKLKPVQKTIDVPYEPSMGYKAVSYKSLMMHFEPYMNGEVKLVRKLYTNTGQLIRTYGWSEGAKYLQA